MKLNSNTTFIRLDPASRLQKDVMEAFKYPTQKHSEALLDQLDTVMDTIETVQSLLLSHPQGTEVSIPENTLYGFLKLIHANLKIAAAYATYVQAEAYDKPRPTTGTDSQALLTLLLQMLKQWRNQEISGNEFEDFLEQSVSLASKMVEGQQS